MIASNLHGVEFIAVNTDMRHSDFIGFVKVQIGITHKGLGPLNPQIGREAALKTVL
jgi:cell division GTPase FtsZ